MYSQCSLASHSPMKSSWPAFQHNLVEHFTQLYERRLLIEILGLVQLQTVPKANALCSAILLNGQHY